MDALHPQRDVHQPEQRSPALADYQKQSSPPPQCNASVLQTSEQQQRHEKIKLREINPYLTCHLCKGYLIDATTISECLHSFCRSCIIKFLEDNSFCPVCEVIINKAKPNLKLDKTLQDIVYKLVPGLFLSEMLRRKHFYAERPGGSAGVSPEQRGEDTERTIFNPQDRISLSLEYIGDEATSGRILKGLKSSLEQQQACDSISKTPTPLTDDVQTVETLLKRYLQCPGMCRIDVIKKFIRNKYNVNTDLFQIDILYKRVPLPLPDHYTLIDVAYIYTWKRNEPMRFYFRIIEKGNDELPDLTKVFTTIDAPLPPIPIQTRTTPLPKKISKICSTPETKERRKKTPKKKDPNKKSPTKPAKKEEYNKHCDNKKIINESETKSKVKMEKSPEKQYVASLSDDKEKLIDKNVENVIIKRECEAKTNDKTIINRENKENVVSSPYDFVDETEMKEEVYTKITLNRTNNIEIITKIHKVSDKDGQSIGMNIINQTVKTKNNNDTIKNETIVQTGTFSSSPLNKTETELELKKETTELKPETPTVIFETPSPLIQKPEDGKTTSNKIPGLTDDDIERKKFEFLKSIELTSKKVVDNLAKMMAKQQIKSLTNNTQQSKPISTGSTGTTTTKPCYTLKSPIPSAAMEILKTKKLLAPKPVTSNGAKRKNSSPTKNDSKKPKTEPKRTAKIILQQKPGYSSLNPLTSNTVSHDNVLNQSRNDLHSLFQNCRLNIPSSLSITLKENGETSRKPLQMPPVQNYIEILKIEEKEGKKTITLKHKDAISTNRVCDPKKSPDALLDTVVGSSGGTCNVIPTTNQSPKTNLTLPKISPSDQGESSNKSNEDNLKSQQQSFQKIFEESIKKSESDPIQSQDISVDVTGSGKRNILEIAQQLYKKTKTELDLKKNNGQPNNVDLNVVPPPVPVPIMPKMPIPRLNNQRVLKPPKKNQKYEMMRQQTLTNLHSTSLGLNYTVSVGKQPRDLVKQTYTVNGIMSTQMMPQNNTKLPLSSPVKENSLFDVHGKPFPSSDAIRSSPVSPKTTETKPTTTDRSSPKNPKVPHSPRPNIASPAAPKSEQASIPSSKNFTPRNYSAKTPQSSPKPRSNNSSPKPAQSLGSSSVSSTSSASLTPNQLLEKYNIQNLAQLSASMNFNAAAAAALPPNYLSAVQGNQMAALHQAMLIKQFEMQNRQKWLNINQGPLLQFEKYLQSLNASKNQILSNIKDN